MQVDQVKQAIQTTPKGANIVIEWVRPMKTRKGITADLTKSVRMVGRMGIEYDNVKKVQDKRENGELPSENQGLPWGKWAEYPYLIEHKGTFYVRLYNGTSEKVKPEVHFFQNGVEVEKEAIAAMVLKSEIDSKKGETFTCKVENMTRIHAEAEWVMLVTGNVDQETETVPVPAKVVATAL